jgi:hypothetical protein
MKDAADPDPEVPERARGPRRYSAKSLISLREARSGLKIGLVAR